MYVGRMIIIIVFLWKHISVIVTVIFFYCNSQLTVLTRKQDEILRRLLRYPPVEDVHVMVEFALNMKNGVNTIVMQEPAPKPSTVDNILDALLAPPSTRPPPPCM